jgi:hypothetical protein
MIALSVPAQASISGRRNTAYGATGLALYELARGHTTAGLLAAAGAGYAWHRYPPVQPGRYIGIPAGR